MGPAGVATLTSFIGVVVQLAGSLLLVLLFVLLRRYMTRRGYFAVWGVAWIALSLALLALVIRYQLLLGPALRDPGDAAPRVRALYFIYQCGKLLYLVLLIGGTLMYARGLRDRRYFHAAILAALAYALLTVGRSAGLTGIVGLQAAPAVAGFLFCGWLLLMLPRSRQTLGSRVTGSFFAAHGLVWSIYLVGFGMDLRVRTGITLEVLRFFVEHNSYLDVLLQVLLGYGMVVMLMEDAKREVDDAHAELAVAHDQLRRASLYDALTGALNRRAFAEGVGLESAKATYGTVVMIDMDNLKEVNDAYGHAAGDALLQHLVDALRLSLRPSDRLYRWGGDEFLIVFPGARTIDMSPRLALALSASARVEIPGLEGGLTLSASFGASDYASAEELSLAIRSADVEMYKQKHARHERARTETAS